MNIKETLELIKSVLPRLVFKSSYEVTTDDKPYFAKDLILLREIISELEPIDLISMELNLLKESSLFADRKNENYFTANENRIISDNLYNIKNGLEFLLRYKNQIDYPENGLFIKLPEIHNFEDLSRVSNDLKKAIELPILELEENAYVNIEKAESGSIWLIVSVGVFTAVNLVAAICWSSAVLRKKRAEANIFEEHAKTLNLKNDALKTILDAQQIQLKNLLDAEAEEISKKFYNVNSPEVFERLKLSLNTMNDLIDRGTQILPSSDKKEVLNNFPDYSNLNLIESKIKKLQTGE